MKIYIQDHGVFGVLVAIAENEEQARDFMEGSINYSPKVELEERDLIPGLIVENYGDT